MTDLVTEIWVVSCDRLTEAQARARIESQLPLKEKVAMADVVLNNDSTVEDLLRQVDIGIKQRFISNLTRILRITSAGIFWQQFR
jgi:dephospho-CoA kinase